MVKSVIICGHHLSNDDQLSNAHLPDIQVHETIFSPNKHKTLCGNIRLMTFWCLMLLNMTVIPGNSHAQLSIVTFYRQFLH